MIVRFELNSDVEAALTEQARAKGLALNAFLQNVIEDFARTHVSLKPSVEEFRAALDKLAEMGKSLPHVPSPAFNRDSIYRDPDWHELDLPRWHRDPPDGLYLRHDRGRRTPDYQDTGRVRRQGLHRRPPGPGAGL